MMKNEKRLQYVTRDTLLKLLSDDEIARVSTAETAAHLAEDDEYVDLEEPDRGVQRMHGKAPVAMGRLLPRKAVHEDTWHEVIILLAAHKNERTRAHVR